MLRINRNQGSPKWFYKFAKEEGFDPRDTDLGLDHPRHFKQIALFASYPIPGVGLSRLLVVCAKGGLGVHVRAGCFYSDDTFGISIYRPEDYEAFRACYKAESIEIQKRRKSEAYAE